METLPKVIASVPESKEGCCDNDGNPNTYANCNICRNFSNVLKSSHRKSKVHQDKMTEKFKILRNRIRVLGKKMVSVHDEEWQKKDALFCYFCDKIIKKHKISAGFMIDSLGYMTHVASPEHAKAVKAYLKLHEREENYDMFCFSKEEFDKFLGKIPEARENYIRKLDLLDAKDVKSIRDIEEQRKKLVAETIQNSVVNCETSLMNGLQSPSANILPIIQEHDNKQEEKYKVPPWQMEENRNEDKKNICTPSVIGPTIETLNKHVASQNKKRLPSARLASKSKLTGEYTYGWMPDFKGVWNKGKRKYSKSRFTRKR